MLRSMRMYWERGDYREACAVATNAAPYVHARLQSVEAKVELDVGMMTTADERRERGKASDFRGLRRVASGIAAAAATAVAGNRA